MIAPFTVWFDDSRGRGYELAGAVAERADAVDMMRRLPRAVVLFGSRVIAQRDGADVDAAIDAAKAFIEAPRYPLSAVAEAPVEAPADPAEEHAVVGLRLDAPVTAFHPTALLHSNFPEHMFAVVTQAA